ncbi:MAG: Ig-like domain repeat protein [Bacteroidetes bacterium]|nr:Ig-like domain repeat protein [Bacteroidota bacterium]
MQIFSGKRIPIILYSLIILIMSVSCGYDNNLFEKQVSTTESIAYQELEGIPAPEVMFFDAYGNELQINTTADMAGAYLRLIRGPGIEDYWIMQYKFRHLELGSRTWDSWGDWENYNDAERPQIGESGEYEIQVRYADPFSDPDNPPLSNLSDTDLKDLRFILIEKINKPGAYINEGEVVDDDVRAFLPNKKYLTIDGEILTPQIWIKKESTGTIYKSKDFILLEVLEGYVNTYQARILYISPDEEVVSESSIFTFTIDKCRPGKIEITDAGFTDEDGFLLPPGTRTNRDASFTISFPKAEEALVVQYNINGEWVDMSMADENTAYVDFTIPFGQELDITQLFLRLKDVAGNITLPQDEIIYDEGIYIDKTIPPAPEWDLKSNGKQVNGVVSDPAKLTARIPKGEQFGSYEFSYDGNDDGIFTEWQKLPIGISQEFTGVEGAVITYTVRIRFSDISGNISAMLEKSFTSDRALPDTPLWNLRDIGNREITDGRIITDSAFFNVIPPAEEPGGISQYRVRISDIESYTKWVEIDEGETIEFSGEENRSVFYTLQIRFIDAAGNSSEILTRDFSIDRKVPDAPAWSLVTGDDEIDVFDNAYIQTPAELHATKPAGEKVGIFEYHFKKVDEDAFSEWETLAANGVKLFDTEEDTESQYHIEIRFRDEVGNVSEVSTRTITIDKRAPDTPFWSLIRYTYGVQVGSGEDTINGPVRLYATAPPNEPAGGVFEYHLQIREDPFLPWAQLPPGYYTSFEGAYRESVQYHVQIRFRDSAGNVSPVKEKIFLVDRNIPAPPEWKLEDIEGREIFEDRELNLPAVLTAQDPINEAGGTYEYSYTLNDTGDFSDWMRLSIGFEKRFEGFEDENTKYTIRIRYVDRAANSSPESERSFYIDYERPAAPVRNLVDSAGVKVTNGQLLNGEAILTGTDPSYESGGTFQYSYDDNRDGEFTDWISMDVGDSITFLGKPESKVWITLKLRYIDSPGNAGVESLIEFKIDRVVIGFDTEIQ